MKITFIILALLILVFIASFYYLGLMSKSGNAPGLINARLTECPASPNCVCSEHPDDGEHHIDPITYTENTNIDQLTILKNIILEIGGTLQTQNDNYIAAIFSSKFFGFVDDVEIRVDPVSKKVQLRSASRVGYSDMGVNKKRTELIKKLYYKKNAMGSQG